MQSLYIANRGMVALFKSLVMEISMTACDTEARSRFQAGDCQLYISSVSSVYVLAPQSMLYQDVSCRKAAIPVEPYAQLW